MRQAHADLFGYETTRNGRRLYRPVLSARANRKGVLDVDTVKGCSAGLRAYPRGGCYGECYALKTATQYGFEFSASVTRAATPRAARDVFCSVRDHRATWYRIGTAGDPSHDWEATVAVCELLGDTGKTPVIVTKHWETMTDKQLARLHVVSAVVNTSTSGMDTDAEIAHRVGQIGRLRRGGLRSVCRAVTCDYGTSAWASECRDKQDMLMRIEPHIDNPLRASKSNPRVLNGDIRLSRLDHAIGGGKMVSLHSSDVHVGPCETCPDQCGVDQQQPARQTHGNATLQVELFTDVTGQFKEDVEWVFVESVIGSGYEADVSRIAIEDVTAKRAARKNMQIHSAIILLVGGEFRGFNTFQINHVSREFCLLQSVIDPDTFSKELYAQMVREVLACNTFGYPAIITTDPKSKFETPKLFESLGFQTYLKMSGFHYMVRGALADVRMKLLAHITMTNVWNSVKGDWLRLKKEWRARIDTAGENAGVENPAFASREGCWQGEKGMANVVTRDPTKKGKEKGRAHNGNASVLDPVSCEIIARFFMPTEGLRIYNPFGGGVQFGYVAGACGFSYVASEIRQNQCDANNKICSEFDAVRWIKSDSSTYEPDGMFDLVFSCPPYYKVERYTDYDGLPPDGEINSEDTYEKFRELLFSGYKKAIAHLNDNRFFVVMTGDSRDKHGAYHCHEAETEIFLKDNGLSLYNKIIYLESEFTRLAHAKKTLHTRKFPKREQRIIVAYKGKMSEIKNHFAPLGRL